MINSFKQRASTFEFCQVCNVNKVLINMNNELEDEWLPLKFPQGIRPGMRLWHLPDLHYVFLNNSGGDLKNRFFSASEGGK